MVVGTRYWHVEQLLRDIYRPGMHVLELGCGGAVYRSIFDRYIGIDLPSTVYDQARSVDVFCDAQRLPFVEQSFDLIFTVACLLQIPDTASTLEECYRVLRPGGTLAVFDYNKVTCSRLQKLYEQKGCDFTCHIWSPRNLRDLVKRAGFEARIIRDSYFWRDSGNPVKEWIKRSRSVRFVLHELKQRAEGWNIVTGTKPE